MGCPQVTAISWPGLILTCKSTLGKQLIKASVGEILYSAYRTPETWWGGNGLGLFVNLPQNRYIPWKEMSMCGSFHFDVFATAFAALYSRRVTFAVLNIN